MEGPSEVVNGRIPAFSESRIWFNAIGFLTRIPCPKWCDHHAVAILLGSAWYPTIGAIVGAWSAACHGASAAIWKAKNVPSVVACASSIWMTGCFHEDGLGDTLDGFGGGWTTREILNIMQDSRVGSYAAVGFTLFFIAKISLLTELGPSHWEIGGCRGTGPSLVVAHALARVVPSVLLVSLPYVDETQGKEKGEFYRWLGRSRDVLSLRRALFAIATAWSISVLVLGISRTIVCSATVSLVAMSAGWYGRRMIGGIMGDYLGATTCIAEISVYGILAADFRGLEDAYSIDPWTASTPFLFLGIALASLLGYVLVLLPLFRGSSGEGAGGA